MAPWMRWAVAIVALCTATGALIVRRENPPDANDARARAWQLQSELNRTNRARVQWATLREILPLIPDAGAVVDLDDVLPADAPDGWAAAVGDSARAQIERSVEADLSEHGSTRARIAVVALTEVAAPVAEANRLPMPVQYFAGRDSLGGWCAVVLNPLVATPGQLVDAVHLGGSALGPCRWWAAYGTPGTAIADRLPDAGNLLGAGPSTLQPLAPRRYLFGLRAWDNDAPWASLGMQSCIAGRSTTCTAALFDSGEWSLAFWAAPTDDDVALLARNRYFSAPEITEHFFADVEEEIGPDAFARLWRADGDLERALGTALGTDADSWIHEWATARYGTEPQGPTADASTILLTLLTIALLIQASIIVAGRRRIA